MSTGGAPAPLLVVVTGPPAAGKSTVATELARELRLPLLAKDGFKETLFDALGTGDREWSRRLGRATFPLLLHAVARVLEAGGGAVLEANFTPGRAEAELAALPAHRRVQVWCTAPVDVLVERYARRAAGRHPGHLDTTMVDEIRARVATDEWGPLAAPAGPARLFELDTSRAFDLGPILAAAHAEQ